SDIAFVEDQIDHLKHGAEAFAPLLPTRRLERNAGIPQGPLGAHDALADGGFRTRKARPISGVESPPSILSASAARCSVGSTGWQAVKISRNRSSSMSSATALHALNKGKSDRPAVLDRSHRLAARNIGRDQLGELLLQFGRLEHVAAGRVVDHALDRR